MSFDLEGLSQHDVEVRVLEDQEVKGIHFSGSDAVRHHLA
jgi:hypothetical protein